MNTTDTITINTDTLQLTGGAFYIGMLDPVSGAGTFTFDGISGTNFSIFGTRMLGLWSKGVISFTGTIDLLGSGGLQMVAVGAMTLANLQTAGSGATRAFMNVVYVVLPRGLRKSDIQWACYEWVGRKCDRRKL